nr:hypothetical protein [Micromonospora sp. DSM 115978]
MGLFSKKDDNHQAFQRSGQTGKTRSICPPGTADQARNAVNDKRQRLVRGSPDTFEVRPPRRGGKR